MSQSSTPRCPSQALHTAASRITDASALLRHCCCRDTWFNDLPDAVAAGAALLGLSTGSTLPTKDMRLPARALTTQMARTILQVMPQLEAISLNINDEWASYGEDDAVRYGEALTAMLQPSQGGLAHLCSLRLDAVAVRRDDGGACL